MSFKLIIVFFVTVVSFAAHSSSLIVELLNAKKQADAEKVAAINPNQQAVDIARQLSPTGIDPTNTYVDPNIAKNPSERARIEAENINRQREAMGLSQNAKSSPHEKLQSPARIDPEKLILTNGYHHKVIGDDGKTMFYSFTERVPTNKITELEYQISKLPKHAEAQKGCDFLHQSVKSQIANKNTDVTLANYGYNESSLVCALKYKNGSNVGTQLVWQKLSTSGMYMFFVVD